MEINYKGVLCRLGTYLGITTKPFFIIKAIDDEYVDSYSIIGHDDGQESLEKFIREYL